METLSSTLRPAPVKQGILQLPEFWLSFQPAALNACPLKKVSPANGGISAVACFRHFPRTFGGGNNTPTPHFTLPSVFEYSNQRANLSPGGRSVTSLCGAPLQPTWTYPPFPLCRSALLRGASPVESSLLQPGLPSQRSSLSSCQRQHLNHPTAFSLHPLVLAFLRMWSRISRATSLCALQSRPFTFAPEIVFPPFFSSLLNSNRCPTLLKTDFHTPTLHLPNLFSPDSAVIHPSPTF